MADKEFVVSHPRAREPLTIKGKNLSDALEQEGLSPEIWQEIEPPAETPPPEDG